MSKKRDGKRRKTDSATPAAQELDALTGNCLDYLTSEAGTASLALATGFARLVASLSSALLLQVPGEFSGETNDFLQHVWEQRPVFFSGYKGRQELFRQLYSHQSILKLLEGEEAGTQMHAFSSRLN